MRPARILSLLTLALALSRAAMASEQEGNAFFEKSIRPILIERCYDCHSAGKKIKGNLRLDSRAGWEKGGDSGPAIVPGKATNESPLIEAVRYANRDLQMPPKQKLPAAEVALLEQWVAMGAPDPRTEMEASAGPAKKHSGLSLEEGRKFWCYAPLGHPEVPAVKETAWPRGAIDGFTLARMEQAGVSPAPDATPAALVRRLYYTLVGLPPSPQEIDAFAKAAAVNREEATAALVDDLLARPQFGETWGRHWLDVARFAESSGGGRTLLFKDAWRYRDYVIDAFNRDLPFDQFIREQIAGDLLPSTSTAEARRHLTATAFLALGPTNYEEQDKQQLRYDIIDEQMDTLGRAFLGQTIGCARCHDHKFDPISQRDYYALAGIFASTRTLASYTENVTHWIAAPLPAEGAEETALRAHDAKVAAMEAELETARTALASFTREASKPTVAPGKPIAASALAGIVMDDKEAKLVGNWLHKQFVKTFIGESYLSDDNTGKGEKTATFVPNVPKTGRYEVRLAYTPLENRAKRVRVAVLHADGEDSVFIDQTMTPAVDGHFVSLGKFRFEKDGAGYVLITNENTTGFVTVDALQLIPEDDPAALAEGADDSAETKAEKKRGRKLRGELAKLKKQGPPRETAMSVRDDAAPADAQIRLRGIEKQRGEAVPRGFLQVALAAEKAPEIAAGSSGRRELAEWIASAENPLTARVAVNRVWAWLFGAGIVRTVDLFGTTGEAPSDPALLDYLANRFLEEHWSVKRLVREIVLSRTWQLSVQAPSAADPENRLFAHANRRRLDAEQLRDGILAVSGSLDLAVGGLNIAGAGDIDPNNFSAQNVEYSYVFSDTRRSVYVPAFRNKRLELFEVFDFGDANQSAGLRAVSTVAPQALFFLNHPFVREQSKLAAIRTLASDAATNEARLSLAYRRALGREPNERERAKCLAFLAAAPGDPQTAWAQIHQMLFACLDFRYLP